MDVKEKPKFSCTGKAGPGPAYLLPSLVGYNGHDPSRYRNPAFTMRTRVETNISAVGPGPRYKIEGLTNYGVQKAPAYSLGFRDGTKMTSCSGPGPGAYSPERCPPMNHSLRPAAFTIKSRCSDHMSGDGPGPIYLIPSCLGPKVPDKTALGAFSIAGRHGKDYCVSSPGPAAYGNQNYDLVKRRLPAYTLASRHHQFGTACGPGPRYYPQYSGGKNPPKFSFGVKHSECAPPAITEYDEE
ncbi:ciliary microtubule associated protein 1A [Neodiprion pinetum]|uniref:Outer dense fiber protein 3-like n=1 Tax=Neodiprion lecontei TaxID=441921 RepID=A0ABM3GPJ3_NEOLC|nr:outer dense fiber protein 3-like [Neodiprion fabricii]XP_046491934.1 outer dense fiber protein 3-like [Neodiprion pinetum]XP_046602194.1 outer dense fiber protein 3-like [Neodiprion lecontei]XP_046627669.1 outer dense fiber protein 3-like [Neodiprion virginianus]